MSEKINITKPAEAHGRVTIKYADPLTGKVREQINGNNMAFGDSFDTANWADFLNQTTYDSMFITDDGTPTDADFPYMRGNIIGVGRNGAASDSLLRGGFDSANSIIDADSEDGRGRYWKFVYGFSHLQLNGNIGAIGLTQQYLSTFATTTLLSPTRRRKFTAPTTSYAYKGERGIKATSNASVTKYFPFSNTTKIIPVSGVTAGTYYATGYNADDERAYIYVYSSTTSLRAMYEFADDGNVE